MFDPRSSAVGGPGGYQAVAASSTVSLGKNGGASNDYLDYLLAIVTDASNAEVQIKDGALSAITVFPSAPAAGEGSYPLPLGMIATNGSWSVITGSGVSVIAVGSFT